MSFARISLALISVNIFLLIIAVYWTATTRQQLNHVKSLPPWYPRTCTIRSHTITSRDRQYRNEFLVFNFSRGTDPDPIPPTVAYRYGSPVYNQTQRQARAFSRKFSLNSPESCWLYPWDYKLQPPYPTRLRYTVSLSPVTNAPTKSQKETATVSVIFTAITATFLFILLCTVLLLSPVDDIEAINARLEAQHDQSSDAHHLSHSTINRLCKSISFEKTASIDACPICLEDEVPVDVQLPCAHSFHRGCITAWLSRGNINCPLCNLTLTADMVPPTSADYDPLTDYGGSGAQDNSDSHSDSSESAETTQVPHSPTRRRQQQQRVRSALSSSSQQNGGTPSTSLQCESNVGQQQADRINSTASRSGLPVSVTVPERVQRPTVHSETGRSEAT